MMQAKADKRYATLQALWRKLTINPVLNKEFMLRMRTPRSMYTLLFYLIAIGLIALSALYLVGSFDSTRAYNPENTRMLFIFISLAQLGLVAFMAPGLTAGAISGERERQTLSLLLTTQQTSTNIVISKLLSSLSFMMLIVFSTLPIYAIYFLYGGISPKQLLFVFLFYLFIMVVIGSISIMFSSLFKRTMLSVIVSYGVTLFMFAGTVILFAIVTGVLSNNNIIANGQLSHVGHLLAWNPGTALYSMLDPNFTSEVYFIRGGNSLGTWIMPLWAQFIIIYSFVSALALWIAIRSLRPRRQGFKQ